LVWSPAVKNPPRHPHRLLLRHPLRPLLRHPRLKRRKPKLRLLHRLLKPRKLLKALHLPLPHRLMPQKTLPRSNRVCSCMTKKPACGPAFSMVFELLLTCYFSESA